MKNFFKPASALALASFVLLAPSAFADEALAKSKNCMSCHSVQKKLVGPSFKDIAAKYGSGSAGNLAGKITNGSSGVWGAVPMPPNGKVSAADANKLASWILSLK